jgi:hypothetical protein
VCVQTRSAEFMADNLGARLADAWRGLGRRNFTELAKAAATSALPVEIGLVRFEWVVGFFVGPIVGHSDRASCNVSINNQEVSMPRTPQWGSSLLN